MPTVSPKRGLRAAAGGDAPSVPIALQNLVNDLEAEVGYLAARSVLDVGQVGQTRAGRVLTVADFTDIGLLAPIGLYELDDVNDTSGNGRHLTNKGAVPFGVGINGVAGEAAVFAGSTGQALYLADTGAADPFRIRTGSWGAWFKTAKRGVAQQIIAKMGATGFDAWFSLFVSSTNFVGAQVGGDTAIQALTSTFNPTDDKWHFAVVTNDGAMMRIYVDGVQISTKTLVSVLPTGTGPLNVGATLADGATAATSPNFGRVQSAFVTANVLSVDQVRHLYAVRVPHGMPKAPRRAGLTLRRRKRGAPLVVGDFPAAPRRLYNFTAGSLADAGLDNQVLTNNAAATSTAGVDGTPGGAFHFRRASLQFLSAANNGLPAGVTAKSGGAWFKTNAVTQGAILSFAGGGGTDYRWIYVQADGTLITYDGVTSLSAAGAVNDGVWHFAVVTFDNAAADGMKRKIYLDGKLHTADTAANGLTLGTGLLRIGVDSTANPGDDFWDGQIDTAFVTDYALTCEQINSLYAKGAQDLGLMPKNAIDHVERIDATNAYIIGDTLEPQHQIELEVAA